LLNQEKIVDDFTFDDYEKFLNGNYPETVVLGCSIGYGTIARQCEPIGFVAAYWSFVNSQEKELMD
jgi:hypothetical protein